MKRKKSPVHTKPKKVEMWNGANIGLTMHETDKTSSFRLNFSTPADEQIIKGCELLGKLSKEMFD